MGIHDIEAPAEEPTVEEVSKACRGVVSDEACDEIATQETLQDALGLAFTALSEAEIEDPEAFLKEKGILE